MKTTAVALSGCFPTAVYPDRHIVATIIPIINSPPITTKTSQRVSRYPTTPSTTHGPWWKWMLTKSQSKGYSAKQDKTTKTMPSQTCPQSTRRQPYDPAQLVLKRLIPMPLPKIGYGHSHTALLYNIIHESITSFNLLLLKLGLRNTKGNRVLGLSVGI